MLTSFLSAGHIILEETSNRDYVQWDVVKAVVIGCIRSRGSTEEGHLNLP